MAHRHLAGDLPLLFNLVGLVTAARAAAQAEVCHHVPHHNTWAHGFDHLLDLREAGAVHVLDADTVYPPDYSLVTGAQLPSVGECNEFVHVKTKCCLVDARYNALPLALVVEPEDRALRVEVVIELLGKVRKDKCNERSLALIRSPSDSHGGSAEHAFDGSRQHARRELEAIVLLLLFQDVLDTVVNPLGRGGLCQGTRRTVSHPVQLVHQINLLACLVAGDKCGGTAREVALVQAIDHALDSNLVHRGGGLG